MNVRNAVRGWRNASCFTRLQGRKSAMASEVSCTSVIAGTIKQS